MKKYLLMLLLVCCFLAGCTNEKEIEASNYFFENGISSWTYEGRFLQLSMQEEQIELTVTEVNHIVVIISYKGVENSIAIDYDPD